MNLKYFRLSLRIFLGSILFFFHLSLLAQDDSRRDPTELDPNRIPGYQIDEPDEKDKPKKDQSGDGISDGPQRPQGTILTNVLGYSEDARFVEIRWGSGFWLGGPSIYNLNKSLRNFGFDSDYTYTYGDNIQKAALYSGSQGYSGVETSQNRMGLLFDKSISEKWSVGGGVDYREYKMSHIPNNILSRSFIVGVQRFPGRLSNPTPDEISQNILLELAGLSTFSNNMVANKIVFLEVNATYHFLSENSWDPYLRPLFALGYDTTNKSYAVKLGGASGIRYYFRNGIYLGGEIAADIIYLAHEKIEDSQGKSRIYDLNYNIFVGKKFD